MQRYDQEFLHMGLLSHDNKTTQYTYVEGQPPLYISYASPEKTSHDRFQETLEAAGDKCLRIKKVTIVNESQQCMEGGLQEEPVEYGVSMPSIKIEYHAVGDTWWHPLIWYGNCICLI